jgi:hypothetical protein
MVAPGDAAGRDSCRSARMESLASAVPSRGTWQSAGAEYPTRGPGVAVQARDGSHQGCRVRRSGPNRQPGQRCQTPRPRSSRATTGRPLVRRAHGAVVEEVAMALPPGWQGMKMAGFSSDRHGCLQSAEDWTSPRKPRPSYTRRPGPCERSAFASAILSHLPPPPGNKEISSHRSGR